MSVFTPVPSGEPADGERKQHWRCLPLENFLGERMAGRRSKGHTECSVAGRDVGIAQRGQPSEHGKTVAGQRPQAGPLVATRSVEAWLQVLDRGTADRLDPAVVEPPGHLPS